MRVEQEEKFCPVTLVLETQDEVDAVGSIFNHSHIIGATKEVFGVTLSSVLVGKRTKKSSEDWGTWNSILKRHFGVV